MQGLDSFALTDTATLTLKSPEDGKTLKIPDPKGELDDQGKPAFVPITISLVRMDCREAVVFRQKQQNQKLGAASRKGRVKITAKEIEEDALDLAVMCTRAWTNFVIGDENLACNAGNVRKVYSDAKFSWILEQVTEFIGEESHFLGN